MADDESRSDAGVEGGPCTMRADIEIDESQSATSRLRIAAIVASVRTADDEEERHTVFASEDVVASSSWGRYGLPCRTTTLMFCFGGGDVGGDNVMLQSFARAFRLCAPTVVTARDGSPFDWRGLLAHADRVGFRGPSGGRYEAILFENSPCDETWGLLPAPPVPADAVALIEERRRQALPPVARVVRLVFDDVVYEDAALAIENGNTSHSSSRAILR